MKTKQQRQEDFERREAARKAKYDPRIAALKQQQEQQRLERQEQKAQKREQGYSPSTTAIVFGVLFPPLGVYQVTRMLIEQHRVTKATIELARNGRVANIAQPGQS